ncbi:MAG: hypothetical protein WCS43_08190, partial [Verrucomicrobiota bacterium]
KRLKPLLSKESFDELMKLKEHDPLPSNLLDFNGNKIDMLGPISINWWHDEGYQTIYQIGQRVYAYDEDGAIFTYVESDVTNVIREYHPSEDEYFEEKCAGFGIKPPLSPAKRGDNGSCRVWINTFYREPHLHSADSSRWVRDDDGKIIWFDNYSAARKWINQDKKNYYMNGMYRFGYNEYDYRQYKISK